MIISSRELKRNSNSESAEYLSRHKRLTRILDSYIVRDFYGIGYKNLKEKKDLYEKGLNQIKVWLGRKERIKDVGELSNTELDKAIRMFRKGGR